MQNVSLWDKFVAITSYYTLGLTGVIWLIASYVVFKKPLTPFCSYHIYQSVFLSVLLYVLSMFFDIAFSLTVRIPFIGDFMGLINLYLFKLPIFYTFSLFNLIIFVILSYLSLGAFLGKLSYFPFVSDIIKSNFRN